MVVFGQVPLFPCSVVVVAVTKKVACHVIYPLRSARSERERARERERGEREKKREREVSVISLEALDTANTATVCPTSCLPPAG
jgi:hypothetical protein